MKYSLDHIELSRAQLGWLCRMYFSHETARQYTWEYSECQGHGKWMPLAVLDAWRRMRGFVSDNAPKPGERESKGWH